MDAEGLGEMLGAVRDCALEMLENATFIEGELDAVHLDAELKVRTVALCSQMAGVKHDAIHELFDIDDMVASGAADDRIAERLRSLVSDLAGPVRGLHALVLDLRAAQERDPESQLAYVLVMESTTNVVMSFNAVAEAAARLGVHPGAG